LYIAKGKTLDLGPYLSKVNPGNLSNYRFAPLRLFRGFEAGELLDFSRAFIRFIIQT
jgi:hypothetical protein